MDWFDPARFFAQGYPDGVTSALRAMSDLQDVLAEEIAALAPRRALEIGPGDLPMLEGREGALYLDLVPRFLAPLRGRAVLGDASAMPFADEAFDLVVASDVFTHVPAPRRPWVLAEMMRLARTIVILNPEPGTHGVEGSGSPTEPLLAALEGRGYQVERRDFRALRERHDKQVDEYWIALLTARR